MYTVQTQKQHGPRFGRKYNNVVAQPNRGDFAGCCAYAFGVQDRLEAAARFAKDKADRDRQQVTSAWGAAAAVKAPAPSVMSSAYRFGILIIGIAQRLPYPATHSLSLSLMFLCPP